MIARLLRPLARLAQPPLLDTTYHARRVARRRSRRNDKLRAALNMALDYVAGSTGGANRPMPTQTQVVAALHAALAALAASATDEPRPKQARIRRGRDANGIVQSWEEPDASATDERIRAALPCGYVFPLTGGPCRAGPDHEVHRENHDYEPKERRSGRDRRAALAASTTDEGRCLYCHESASGVCTLHNGSAALAASATDEGADR